VITDLEKRFADVLGSRLPAPFAGTTTVLPGEPPGAGPSVVLGARSFTLLEPDFGSGRFETVAPVADPRRVVRLAVEIDVEIRPATNEGRAQQLQGLDDVLYALDAPDVRSGAAFVDGTDQGFRLDGMKVVAGRGAPDPAVPAAPPVGLTVEAVGLFWPPGVAGDAGAVIGEVRVRDALLPITASVPVLVAGAGAATVTFTVGTAGPMRLGPAGAPALVAIPFGSLALRLTGPGGNPAGTLTGGTAGAAGVRLVTLDAGEGSVGYEPPAAAATDTLVVALDDGGGDQGIELGRVALVVRAP
jgi:hypothetical protein